MSLDNVIAVAGMAHGHPWWVLGAGLVLSIAFMGVAATFIAGLLKRYHWIAYVGLLIILCRRQDDLRWNGAIWECHQTEALFSSA
jgi:predicted tellurium resistance membrane protein TerC